MSIELFNRIKILEVAVKEMQARLTAVEARSDEPKVIPPSPRATLTINSKQDTKRG
jgi:hypothetical protein